MLPASVTTKEAELLDAIYFSPHERSLILLEQMLQEQAILFDASSR